MPILGREPDAAYVGELRSLAALARERRVPAAAVRYEEAAEIVEARLRAEGRWPS